MEVEYCRLPDGSRIAFERVGRGAITVCLTAGALSTLTADERFSHWPVVCRRIGRGRTVVRFDAGGMGLSDERPKPPDLESCVEEVAAVVDAVGAERVAIVAPVLSGPVGIAYAARYPQRVSHLVLPFTYASGPEYFALPRVRAVAQLAEEDPSLYFEVVASEMLGWAAPEEARQLAEVLRDRVGIELIQAFQHCAECMDAADLLEKVEAKTLVIHRRGLRVMDERLVRELVHEIPDARLALLEGVSILPLAGEPESLVSAIDEFLPRTRAGRGLARSVRLTSREVETLSLVAAGLQNAEIAKELGIAPATVKRHLYKAFRKLGARSRTEAVAIARELSALS